MLSAAHTRGKNSKDITPGLTTLFPHEICLPLFLASIPPLVSDFEEGGRAARDWKTGEDMLRACYETHKTNT
jgi:hypothetical protein